jgi:Arc/MetJ family transcription regulator
MRTTLNINEDLLKQAARLSGITEKTAVVHAGLEALVPVRVLRGWRHWAAASRVCGKFGDAVLRPLWPAADAC